MFYQAIGDMLAECKRSRAWGIATPVVFASMTDKVQSGIALELDLTQKIVEVKYHVLSLGAILRCERYGPIDRLSYPRMAASFAGGAALLCLQLNRIS